MGEVLTQLSEYLLAYQRSQGSPLVRLGTQYFTIPIVPPRTKISVRVTPYAGAYASIIFWLKQSPAVIPNIFSLELQHKGVAYQSGLIGSINTSTSYNTWIEITDRDYALSSVTNLSNCNQYYDTSILFLVVQTEEDLDYIHELIRNFKPNGMAGG